MRFCPNSTVRVKGIEGENRERGSSGIGVSEVLALAVRTDHRDQHEYSNERDGAESEILGEFLSIHGADVVR